MSASNEQIRNQSTNQTMNQITNREVKSSAFTTLFGTPENAASLYAALDDVDSESISAKDITFTTLSGVLFMARKNDMAFTVRNKVLVISEHQSTVNANMPLRDAIYYGRAMEKLIEPRALYRTGQIPLPTPEFFVFFNGTAKFPVEKFLKLSDAYLEKTEQPMLELIVRVININLPAGHPILKRCRPLYEYSCFVQMIRDYVSSGKSRDEAIIRAMADCRQEGFMTDFLREHGTEAVNMLFTEFNMDDALDVRYEEGQKEGMRKGLEQGLEQGKKQGLEQGKKQGLEQGKKQGLEQGKQSMLRLINTMMADGRADELSRLQIDPAFLKEMMVYYHIEADIGR